jgi:hypothetical protein
MTNFFTLKNESRDEIYDYIDKNIRELPKDKDKNIDIYGPGLTDNDVDALRHAYASGRYTEVYDEDTADSLGYYYEVLSIKSRNEKTDKNMDLWNNSVGRKYGKVAKNKADLIELLIKALNTGELIIDPKDPRKYEETTPTPLDPNKPVKAIEETETGLNNVFIDLVNGNKMSRTTFISEIKDGNYPGYTVIENETTEFPVSKPDKTTSNNLG